MARDISREEAEQALKGLSIPPRPNILTALMSEVRSEDPNLRAISSLISSDVGLAATTLKTVNSPFFGLGHKVSSVQQAIVLLGIHNVATLASGLLLRKALGGKHVSLERFWDSAEKVANIAAVVANALPQVNRDEVYTFGLFRDCGIPILMQKFADYPETLRLANGVMGHPMTDVEDERHATNHATIGYLLAKAWFLPDPLPEAILRHHDPSVFESGDHVSTEARTLIAVGSLAEQLHDEVIRLREDHHWLSVGHRVLQHLGLDHDEYTDLKEEVLSMVH